MSKAAQPAENHSNKVPPQAPPQNSKSNDNLYQQRFGTFSKKTGTLKNPYIENNRDVDDDNKLDGTFVKPLDKQPPAPRQIQPPRQLSKLPQLFQKSQPNLGAAFKQLGKLSSDPDATFSKGSQPNISNNGGGGGMYALGRFKSERLLPMKHSKAAAADFPRVSFQDGTGSSRSMESIESTASAHSAPDLDDRLSMCSNSSRASYTVPPRNVEVLRKLASMEEQGKEINNEDPEKSSNKFSSIIELGECIPKVSGGN